MVMVMSWSLPCISILPRLQNDSALYLAKAFFPLITNGAEYLTPHQGLLPDRAIVEPVFWQGFYTGVEG